MKKLISLLAAVAMVSTLFVSVVKADFAPTVITEKEQLSNADFHDLLDEDIPTGYDAYLVTVSFANLGDLDCSIKSKKHSGRKLQGFGYQMTFDNIANVETDYVVSVDNIFGVDLSEGFDGSKFTSIFNAGSASAAYPTTATTIVNATGLPDAVQLVVTVKSDATVVATLDTSLTVNTYTSNTPGTPEVVNHATMSPASLTFAPAAAPTYTEIAADTTQAQKVADPGAKTYKDYDNNDVTLTKSYAIARFVTTIDSAKTYTLHAEATSGSKDFDMNFAGIEVSGTANFITIVKNAPDGTVLTIREQ